MVKPDIGQEIGQFLDVVLLLAGKSQQHRGPQHHVGPVGAQGGEETAHGIDVVRPVHPLQHRPRSVLHGHVDVGRDAGQLHHAAEAVGGDQAGIDVEQPDPAQFLDLRQFGAEIMEVDVRTAPVVGGVLGHELQLAHPARGQVAGLGGDLGDRPVDLAAADHRDAAEGALEVAALGDLHERDVGRRQQGAVAHPLVARILGAADRHPVPGQLQGVDHGVEVPHAADDVDLGIVGGDAVGLLLGQASGHHQPASVLGGGHLGHRVEAVAPRRLDEAAGVHDPDIGLFGGGGGPYAAGGEAPEQGLGIDQVLVAAEGRDVHAQGHRSSSAPSFSTSRSSRVISTSRALLPTKGPTTPACSSRSISRPARA